MNISEVAKITHLSAKQIREYEKIGLLPTVKRNLSGYRHYHAKDVERLKFIYQARQVGFSLEQIGKLLTLQDNPNRNSREVKAITQVHIDEIKAQIQHLQQMLVLLQQWHDSCQGNDCPECAILDSLTRTV